MCYAHGWRVPFTRQACWLVMWNGRQNMLWLNPLVAKCVLLNKSCISIFNLQLHVVWNDNKCSKNVGNFVEKEWYLWWIVQGMNHHWRMICTCNRRIIGTLCSCNNPRYIERFLGWEIIHVPCMKSSISTFQCYTLCYSIMLHATLILYYYGSMLTRQNSIISCAV